MEKINAPVLLIMDEELAEKYLRSAEKKRGQTILLYGDGCNEVKLN
jgi:hypothetical protein